MAVFLGASGRTSKGVALFWDSSATRNAAVEGALEVINHTFVS
jgi:hypothetical protein